MKYTPNSDHFQLLDGRLIEAVDSITQPKIYVERQKKDETKKGKILGCLDFTLSMYAIERFSCFNAKIIFDSYYQKNKK